MISWYEWLWGIKIDKKIVFADISLAQLIRSLMFTKCVDAFDEAPFELKEIDAKELDNDKK